MPLPAQHGCTQSALCRLGRCRRHALLHSQAQCSRHACVRARAAALIEPRTRAGTSQAAGESSQAPSPRGSEASASEEQAPELQVLALKAKLARLRATFNEREAGTDNEISKLRKANSVLQAHVEMLRTNLDAEAGSQVPGPPWRHDAKLSPCLCA